MKTKNIIGILTALALIVFVVAYGFSTLDKVIVSAALQYQVDLENPPGVVFAILTKDQKLPTGRVLPQGSRLVGSVKNVENDFEIYFDTVQLTNGKKGNFAGKVAFASYEDKAANGISSKIGKTIYQKTKTSVLGAIFTTKSTQQVTGSIIPRGTTLNIEVE